MPEPMPLLQSLAHKHAEESSSTIMAMELVAVHPLPPDCCPTKSSSLPSKSCSLPSLRAVEIKPHWRYQVPSITKSLLRIERIEVKKQPESRHIYTVNVYFRQNDSRIPTNAGAGCRSTKRAMAALHPQPDVQVSHSFLKVAAFRDNVQSCVAAGHQSSPCVFCKQLGDFLTIGAARSMVFARLGLNHTCDASEEVEVLLTRFLGYCRRLLLADRRERCRGQRHVPYLLYAMLYGAELVDASCS